MVIAVIDGMGGGIGAQIVSNLREELPTYIDIYALGMQIKVQQERMLL